ncbi:hypothetical protein B0T13DRAFT_193935 [Neurospora crassa]|nr:hypothetical protein B0T13DRAFT_193935 [Neurospora crassa]
MERKFHSQWIPDLQGSKANNPCRGQDFQPCAPSRRHRTPFDPNGPGFLSFITPPKEVPLPNVNSSPLFTSKNPHFQHLLVFVQRPMDGFSRLRTRAQYASTLDGPVCKRRVFQLPISSPKIPKAKTKETRRGFQWLTSYKVERSIRAIDTCVHRRAGLRGNSRFLLEIISRADDMILCEGI